MFVQQIIHYRHLSFLEQKLRDLYINMGMLNKTNFDMLINYHLLLKYILVYKIIGEIEGYEIN
jgi:hypothetical protein